MMPDPYDGVLPVAKPSGMTSHDVVARIRRRFKLRKVGHGGTLDPQATGLLVILIGRATRISDAIMGADKVYEGELTLGVMTDSYDADGEVREEHDPSGIAGESVAAVMQSLQGDMMQTPPMFSAVKKDGVPLYKMARKGQSVERTPRLIHVYEFRLLEFVSPRAAFRLRCTKGVYVRSLCHDIGLQLGCGAHLSRLCRTHSGDLCLEDAVPMDELLAGTLDGLAQRLIPMSAFRMPQRS